jgi:hypothetical protein
LAISQGQPPGQFIVCLASFSATILAAATRPEHRADRRAGEGADNRRDRWLTIVRRSWRRVAARNGAAHIRAPRNGAACSGSADIGPAGTASIGGVCDSGSRLDHKSD